MPRYFKYALRQANKVINMLQRQYFVIYASLKNDCHVENVGGGDNHFIMKSVMIMIPECFRYQCIAHTLGYHLIPIVVNLDN